MKQSDKGNGKAGDSCQRDKGNVSIKQINKLLERLTNQVWSTGGGVGEVKNPPPGGIEFRPQNVNLFEGKETRVRLRIDTSVIGLGTTVMLDSSSDSVSVDPEEFELVLEPNVTVLEQVIVLLGKTAGEEAVVQANAAGRRAQLYVEVISEVYPTPVDGFSFIPDVVRIPNNERRYAWLYIDKSVASPGDIISIQVDNDQIELGVSEVMLETEHFRNNVAKINVPVKGSGIGSTATLRASVNSVQTSALLRIVSLRSRRRGQAGLITGYDFSPQKSRLRSSYDEDSGLIWVYLQNPNVEMYFGNMEIGDALKLPHCQVFLAEVILERVAWLARTKMIESGAAMYLSDNRAEEDLNAVRKFIYDYGNTIHSWIVDETAVARAIDKVGK